VRIKVGGYRGRVGRRRCGAAARGGYFAIRAGARRLADAAVCLAFIGENKAADIADEQARLVGALQHPLVTGDRATVAALLRRLAPMYEQLRACLPDG
jgi:hypothetical protein